MNSLLLVVLVAVVFYFIKVTPDAEGFTLTRGCGCNSIYEVADKNSIKKLIKQIQQDDKELDETNPCDSVKVLTPFWRPDAMTLNEAKKVKPCHQNKDRPGYLGFFPEIYRAGSSYEYPTF